jgi:hypothetical protein
MRRAYSSLDSPAECKMKKLRSIAIIFVSEIVANFVRRKFVSKTIEMELMDLLNTQTKPFLQILGFSLCLSPMQIEFC